MRHVTMTVVALFVAVALAGCAEESRRAAPTAADVTPALVGDTVPAVNLWVPGGDPTALRGVLAEKPTVLIVYRGNWCVYCNKQLEQLEKIEPKLAELGYQVVAISPDTPDELRKAIERHKLSYQLLSDMRLEAARELGLAYYADATTRRDLERFGVEPAKIGDQPIYMLPVPAVFIVDQDGTIRFQYVNRDFRQRLDPDVLLDVARSFSKMKM